MFSNFCNYVKVLIGFDLCRGGGLTSKGRYGCVGPGIKYLRGQFLPGNLVLGGKFCLGIRYLAIFDKMCNI